MAIKPDHAAVKLEQARMILEIENRRSAARNRNRAHAIWKFPAGRIRVRRAARYCENTESLDSQMIRQLLNNLRPIDQLAIWLKTRIANSGPVRRNNFHAELARSVLGQLRHCPRARPTVKKENRVALRGAVFAKGKPAAVCQR